MVPNKNDRPVVQVTSVILMALLVVAVGYFAFASKSSQSRISSGAQSMTSVDSTLSSLTSLSATNSSGDGLELIAAVNPTSPTAGQNISIAISLFNSLSSQLNISTTNPDVPAGESRWIVNGFPVALWGGCYGLEPVEFMIVRGNYSIAELSSASANSSVYSSAIPTFSCAEGGSTTSVEFRPDSNLANATCIGFCPASRLLNLTSTFTVSGYWAYPINNSEAADVATPPSPECLASGIPDCTTFNYPEVGPFAQHGFVPGSYSMAVSDEWGQAIVLHFSVTPGTRSSQTAPGLPPGCAFAKTVTVNGITMDIYLSPAPALGSTVCLYDHLQSTPPELPQGITFTITNSTSRVFFVDQCVGIQSEPGSCSTSWNTAQSYKGTMPVGGSYRLLVNFGGETMDTGISFILSA